VAGSLASVLDFWSGLAIFDVSNPSEPLLAGAAGLEVVVVVEEAAKDLQSWGARRRVLGSRYGEQGARLRQGEARLRGERGRAKETIPNPRRMRKPSPTSARRTGDLMPVE
jgi:hypothetical protein